MDMSGHVTAGPLWTCVKVADCCDLFFCRYTNYDFRKLPYVALTTVISVFCH
jgi:hypothetical protein